MRKDWFPTFSPRPILQIEQAIKAKTKNIKLHFAGEWPESSKLQAHSSNMVLMKHLCSGGILEGYAAFLSQLVSLSHNTIVKSFLIQKHGCTISSLCT